MLIRTKRWASRWEWWLGALALTSALGLLVWAMNRLQDDPSLVASIVRASHEVSTLDWDREASTAIARRF